MSHMIELSLPSVLGYEKVAIVAIATLARKLGFSQERVDDLKTAMGEAIINAIEHGNQLNEQFRVSVMAMVEEHRLILKVIDHGQQPLPTPSLEREDRVDHRGWGLFLIKSLTDGVKTNQEPGRHELEMIMNRNLSADV